MHRTDAAALVLAVLLAVSFGPVRAGEDAQAPPLREGARLGVPLYGEVLRWYDAPDDPYAPGHRGIDVASAPGSPVYASADGAVLFAGSVAGNRSVTVDHTGGLRTTYSYLESILVAAGQAVVRGTPLGTVGAGHPGSGLPSHVHLSARRDAVYFDPLTLYVGSSYADLLSIVE